MRSKDIWIYAILILLVAGFGLNAWGQISATFDYQIPTEYWEFFKMASVAALGVQTFAQISSALIKLKESKEADHECEKK